MDELGREPNHALQPDTVDWLMSDKIIILRLSGKHQMMVLALLHSSSDKIHP